MASAFPKTNLAIMAPLGAAALFWAWFGLSPARAFRVGWLAGTVFLGITFAWFGETAGALIAPFGFIMALGPALADAFFGFALTGALVGLCASALARRDRVARALVPLGAAAIFTVGEWLRSEGLGVLGVPFGQLGFTQVASPLAPLASFGGSYAVTFVVCVLGAYAAYAIRMRSVRGSGVDAGIALVATLAVTALAWTVWPARSLPPATIPVAAVQGNIAQSIKARPESLALAIDRYERLTGGLAGAHPAIVVWPETVVLAVLNAQPQLRARFAALAERIGSELVVGTLDVDASGEYNVLYFFRPDGGLDSVYRKRQLVPFAEHLPFAAALAWIPWTRDISHFASGTDDGVVKVGALRYAPIICWESAFGELVRTDVARAGATALIIATDDAWFGTTAGPYQHAEIAQMRALETGRWVVRAAATGISGTIAPNGRYTRATQLNTETVALADIGPPVDTVFDAVGTLPFVAAFGAIYLAVVWRGRARNV